MRRTGLLAFILGAGLLAGAAPVSWAQGEPAQPEQEEAVGQMPPRLAYTQGQVSFWRVGAPEWVQAQVNTPLAAGDQLYTGSPGNVEIQIGGRAFVRGWAKTQIGLETHEPDYLQFKVTTGSAAFDIRTLESGRTVEVSTPGAAFTIEHAGYYRVDVSGDRTSFIARRSGRATAMPASGAPVLVAPSEELVVDGIERPQIASYTAPALDAWDKWNYARTDALLDALSARYVTPGTYGVDDLDRHGAWRVVPEYGPVWVPSGLPPDWAPYTTGSWIHDPYYGWTWVDTAPWGWAPYHHGRWVHLSGVWAWAPGPLLPRPVYAPALVAFLGDSGVAVGVGGPLVAWVALGWGEPCVPWWGRPNFVHRPWWGGWGGPRVVNNVVIQRTTVVRVEEIHAYRNSDVRHGLVAVDRDRFGHGRVAPARLARVEPARFRPAHGAPDFSPSPASLTPSDRRGIRPPGESERRPVVATHRAPGPPTQEERGHAPAERPAPEAGRGPAQTPARAPFGQGGVERSTPPAAARPQPPAPPRVQTASPAAPAAKPEGKPPARIQAPAPAKTAPPAPAKPEAAAPAKPEATAPAKTAPAAPAKPEAPAPVKPQAAPAAPTAKLPAAAPAQPQAGKGTAAPRATERSLPGQSANRLAPNRGDGQRAEQRQAPAARGREGQAAPQAQPRAEEPAAPRGGEGRNR